jgi:hypothetical protein
LNKEKNENEKNPQTTNRIHHSFFFFSFFRLQIVRFLVCVILKEGNIQNGKYNDSESHERVERGTGTFRTLNFDLPGATTAFLDEIFAADILTII